MIGMLEIESSVDTSFTGCGEDVGDEQKEVMVFLGDFVEALIVNAESK